VDDLWATTSEDVGLTVSFQDFQPMRSRSTNVTDGQTDGQTTCDSKTVKTAFCTVVHHAVKTRPCTSVAAPFKQFKTVTTYQVLGIGLHVSVMYGRTERRHSWKAATVTYGS